MSNVRPATIADEENLFWLILNDLDADNSLGFSASPKKVYEHVRLLCRGEKGVAGVIDGPHGIIASVGIELVQPWHSEDWLLMQVWQFVHPAHRKGSKYAEQLFSFAEEYRRYMTTATGRDMILETTVMSHNRLAAKTRLWRRHGKQIGSMFWSGMNV